ncbi:MAG: recombinase family protein [Patescibacteria group bacterium]
MKKGIILARVSTPEQQKQGLSIDDIQLPQLRQYAKDNGIEIVNEFVFQETASQKLRKKFDEMIAAIKASNDITEIIAFRVDRMTRNYRDAVEMDSLRLEYGKQLHFLEDRLILHKKSFGKEIKDWDTAVYLAKQHINNCQEHSHNTLQSKLKNQEIYGLAPYGYENYRDENNKASVKVVSYEAGIVRKIFDWYSTGAYSYLQISQRLRVELGLEMHKSKVEKILKNTFYIGYRIINEERFPHKYERIIKKEVWDICENIRSGRGLSKHQGKFAGKHGIFRGLLTCSECGCSITPEMHSKTQKNGNMHKWIYYHCTGAKGKHKDTWVEEDKLAEQFAVIYKHMQIPEVDLEKMTKTLKEAHKGKVNFNTEMFDESNKQIKRLENRIEKAYEDKLDGSITQDEYDNYRKKFRAEQQDYKEKLGRLEQADEEYYITVSLLLELASRSNELFLGSEPDEKREIIQLTLQNLSLKEGKLQYTLQKPFDSIFKTAKSLKWGG